MRGNNAMILYLLLNEQENNWNKSALSRTLYIYGHQALGGALGTLAGLSTGALAGLAGSDETNPDDMILSTGTGALVGSGLGGAVGASIGSYVGAKKLGYGKLGKLSAVIVGPLTGLAKPKALKEKQKNDTSNNKR